MNENRKREQNSSSMCCVESEKKKKKGLTDKEKNIFQDARGIKD